MRNPNKRLYTWHEAAASVREGAGEERAKEFEDAMEILSGINLKIKRLLMEKEIALACALDCVTEYIGADAQFIGPDGVIFEKQAGVSVSYPKDALLAAGVSEEQIAQARKETRWETVAGARR